MKTIVAFELEFAYRVGLKNIIQQVGDWHQISLLISREYERNN